MNKQNEDGRNANQKATMYYVIESKYVGPDCFSERHVDSHKVEIHTVPARDAGNGQEILEGRCDLTADQVRLYGRTDTTDNRAVWARGAYATREAARAEIARLYPDAHRYEYAVDDQPDDEDILETHYVGHHAPLNNEAMGHFLHQHITADITAEMTDEDLYRLADSYEDMARAEGATLGNRQDDALFQRRDELRAEGD